MLPPPRLAALLLAALLPLAGCIGGPDEPPATNDTPLNETSAPNATLPDGRGTSAGITETNKTEEGVGGVEHKHDYWKGQDRVVLFDRLISLQCPPCMPDGEGTQPKSVAYVKLGKLPGASAEASGRDGVPAEGADAMVYEGAASVEILFEAPTTLSEDNPAAHPSPAQLFVQYRSAADADWREPMRVTYDTPMVIEVTPEMTDMPHSTHSLWVFRLSTDRPDYLEVPMTVTVVKGREVVDWPGHPDFYADKSSRVVMQQHVTTHMSGIESFALYDSGGTWATPERLISWGTKEITVIVNVTGAKNAYGATPTGYFLEAHNATIIGPEITFGSRHSEINGANDLRTYEFAMLVDEAGMDSPYQPASRWGFRLMATFADIDFPTGGGIGLCPGCFPYDIEYDIVVIAQDFESGRADEMEEV
jgi:hypothetical protein